MAKEIHIDVIKPGLLTLVQDQGRPHYQAFGVPPGGALDRRSAATANLLVGQATGHPLLEIAMLGPELLFRHSTQIALTGADLSATLNDHPLKYYRTITVQAGDRLSFGARRRGCRAYLAIRGEWSCAYWLNSAGSLSLYDQILPPGSRLTTGQRLVLSAQDPIPPRQVPHHQHPRLSSHLSLRVWPGPEFDWFPSDLIDHFIAHAFRLGSQSSRMGCLLQPALPQYEAAGELISSGIVPGTIQVMRSGQAVILLADAQTTGGYPRLANVIDEDLDDLAQLAPGDTVRFKLSH